MFFLHLPINIMMIRINIMIINKYDDNIYKKCQNNGYVPMPFLMSFMLINCLCQFYTGQPMQTPYLTKRDFLPTNQIAGGSWAEALGQGSNWGKYTIWKNKVFGSKRLIFDIILQDVYFFITYNNNNNSKTKTNDNQNLFGIDKVSTR